MISRTDHQCRRGRHRRRRPRQDDTGRKDSSGRSRAGRWGFDPHPVGCQPILEEGRCRARSAPTDGSSDRARAESRPGKTQDPTGASAARRSVSGLNCRPVWRTGRCGVPEAASGRCPTDSASPERSARRSRRGRADGAERDRPMSRSLRSFLTRGGVPCRRAGSRSCASGSDGRASETSRRHPHRGQG